MTKKATKEVITKNDKGEVKAVNEVAEKTVNEVIAPVKVQSIVVAVDATQLEKCIDHYNNRFESRESDLQELFDFGMLFQSAKKSVNNNNKAFGKWRESQFPELTSQFVSYSINLIVHKTEIETWIKLTDAEVTNREYRNPYSVYVAFNRYKKRIADKIMKDMAEEDATEDTSKDTAKEDATEDTSKDTSKDTAKEDTAKEDTTEDTAKEDATEGRGHKVVNNVITIEEKINHYHLIVNQLIPLLNSDKLNDKEIEGIKVAHNSLHVKLKELNII